MPVKILIGINPNIDSCDMILEIMKGITKISFGCACGLEIDECDEVKTDKEMVMSGTGVQISKKLQGLDLEFFAGSGTLKNLQGLGL